MMSVARLRRTRDFDQVYREGKRRYSPHFVLIAGRNHEAGLRIGISVQKRLGNAVVRNRVRRRVRELLRQQSWPRVAGWDLVVQPRTGEVARTEMAALRQELSGLIRTVLET